MSSNLPPGVTDSMIPGNRPEDEEVEITITLCKGELDYIRDRGTLNNCLIDPVAKRVVVDLFDQVVAE